MSLIKSAIILCLSLLLLVSAACGGEPMPEPAAALEPATSAAAADFPYSVVDGNGAEVVFDAPPERIVAFDSAAVETLFAIGEGHRVVATHSFVSHPSEAADIPRVGDNFSMDIEATVALKPDLVFIFFDTFNSQLENAGLKVLYLKTLEDDFKKTADFIRMWGRITGGRGEAERVADEFNDRVTEIESVYASREGGKVFQDVGGLWTPGPDTLVGEVFRLLKLENIAHDISGYAQLSPEAVVARDPDVIITPDPGSIRGNPAFQDLSAVRGGRVFSLQTDALSVAGPRFVDGIEELAALAYSEPAAATFPYEVTDGNGRTIAFDKPPERIVAFDSAAVEALFDIGEGHRVAGTHKFVSFPPEASSVPRVGDAFNMDIEATVALNPDLVFVFSDTFLSQLEGVGLKVLYVKSLNDNFEGTADFIRMWGGITGGIHAAEASAARFEGRVRAVREKMEGVETRLKVFQDIGGFWTPGPNTLVGEVFELLKLDNIAHDISGYAAMSPETIVARDPEIILTSDPDSIMRHPAFKDVSAVKSGRVITPPSEALSIAGPRFAEGIEDLARLIYPELSGSSRSTHGVTEDAMPAHIAARRAAVGAGSS